MNASAQGTAGPELIPSIDLRGGTVVRLQKGDDARRTAYDRDPSELIRYFASIGARRVHIVDLDAAFGEAPQRPLLEDLARQGTLPIELGGGLRGADDLRWAADAGIDRMVLGSLVAKDPDRFAELTASFPGRLVPALEIQGGQVKVAGWTASAALGLDALCARLRGLDCPACLVTDVERDGMLQGPNVDLARRVADATGIPAIVSGGVRDLGDVRAVAGRAELSGLIVGRAFYEGHLDLAEAVRVLAGSQS